MTDKTYEDRHERAADELVGDLLTKVSPSVGDKIHRRLAAGIAALEKACVAPAASDQAGKAEPHPERDAEGYRIVWDWAPWARFIGARAQLIHEAVTEGKSFAEIRSWLSMDEMQVQLISMTDVSQIHGIPGNVWPPKQFQKPEPVTASASDKAQGECRAYDQLVADALTLALGVMHPGDVGAHHLVEASHRIHERHGKFIPPPPSSSTPGSSDG